MVLQDRESYGLPARTWSARCWCGWRGESRPSRFYARIDAMKHDGRIK